MQVRTVLLHPITLFIYGILIGIGGLAWNDYNQIAANATPPRVVAAQRVSSPTPRATATRALDPESTPESTATPETVSAAAVSDATPTTTSESTPTVAATATLGATPTITVTQAIVRRPINTPTPRVTATVVAKLSGDSPFTAIEVTGTWEKLGPNKQVWYKTGAETSFPLRGSIAMDVYGKSGITFRVFAPEQAQNLRSLNVDTIPKGVGSREKHVPHDLFWSGGSPLAGYWYVLVTNSNAAPVDYKLISTFGVSDPKDCFQYYEYYQNGAYVLWTECNRPKPP